MCGRLRSADAGKNAVLMGWVNKRRDHGSLLFIDLRDRSGFTQVVVNADRNAAIHEKAETLRNEYVIAAIGSGKLRDANTVNPNMPTGEVELVADDIRILNESKLPPFLPSDTALTNEETRLSIAILTCGATKSRSILRRGTMWRRRFAIIFRRRDFSRSRRHS